MDDNTPKSNSAGVKAPKDGTKHNDTTISPQKRPFTLRRNIFGLSEASISKPESSQVAAAGRMQPSEQQSASIQDVSASQNPDHASNTKPLSQSSKQDPQTDSPSEGPSTEAKSSAKESNPVSGEHESFTTPSQGVSPATTIVDDASPPNALTKQTGPPAIQIHSPSTSTPAPLSPAFGTFPMASNSSIVLPSAPHSTPMSPESRSKDALPMEPPPSLPQPLPQSLESALKSALPSAPLPSPVNPQLPLDQPLGIGGNSARRRRIVRRLRKVVLRRRVLAALLGSDIGSLAHSQLKQVGGVTEAAPTKIVGL